MNRFCGTVERYSANFRAMDNCQPLAKAVLNMVYKLNRMLYENDESPARKVEVPYRWLIKPQVYNDE